VINGGTHHHCCCCLLSPHTTTRALQIVATTKPANWAKDDLQTTYIDGDKLFGPNTYFKEADEE